MDIGSLGFEVLGAAFEGYCGELEGGLQALEHGRGEMGAVVGGEWGDVVVAGLVNDVGAVDEGCKED